MTKPEECSHYQEYLIVSDDGRYIICEGCDTVWDLEDMRGPPIGGSRPLDGSEGSNPEARTHSYPVLQADLQSLRTQCDSEGAAADIYKMFVDKLLSMVATLQSENEKLKVELEEQKKPLMERLRESRKNKQKI